MLCSQVKQSMWSSLDFLLFCKIFYWWGLMTMKYIGRLALRFMMASFMFAVIFVMPGAIGAASLPLLLYDGEPGTGVTDPSHIGNARCMSCNNGDPCFKPSINTHTVAQIGAAAHSGAYGMALTFRSDNDVAWAWQCNSSVDTSKYTHLQFWIRGTNSFVSNGYGEDIQLSLESSGKFGLESDRVRVPANYFAGGGTPGWSLVGSGQSRITDTWQQVSVPLAAFNDATSATPKLNMKAITRCHIWPGFTADTPPGKLNPDKAITQTIHIDDAYLVDLAPTDVSNAVIFDDFESAVVAYTTTNAQGSTPLGPCAADSATVTAWEKNQTDLAPTGGVYNMKLAYDTKTCGYGLLCMGREESPYAPPGKDYIDASGANMLQIWAKVADKNRFQIHLTESDQNGGDGERWESPVYSGTNDPNIDPEEEPVAIWRKYLIPTASFAYELWTSHPGPKDNKLDLQAIKRMDIWIVAESGSSFNIKNTAYFDNIAFLGPSANSVPTSTATYTQTHTVDITSTSTSTLTPTSTATDGPSQTQTSTLTATSTFTTGPSNTQTSTLTITNTLTTTATITQTLTFTNTAIASPTPSGGLKIIKHMPYPNPVMGKSMMIYALMADVPERMNLKIYTTAGRLVRILGNIDTQDPRILSLVMEGNIARYAYNIPYDLSDGNGEDLGNGVFFYVLEAHKKNVHLKVFGKLVVLN